MKKIGIIAAMEEEVKSIKEKMQNISVKKLYELEWIEGTIHQKEVVLVKCGVGKVNAARTTQILIDYFEIDYILNVGTAGSVNEEIAIGDLVIAENLVQHDFDITAFGHPKGYISDVGRDFKCDSKLIQKAKEVIEKQDEDYHIFIGTIASGDTFCTSIDQKKEIRNQFNADCVEMEGAAIAHVCMLDKIPFLVIRSISDKPNGKNEIDFNQYLEKACARFAKFIDFFMK